jgi:hypothetical protein
MFFAIIKMRIGISVNATKKQEKISRMILNYLRKNPNAGDTLEGITKWWLELERIDASVDDVACLLDDLIQKGIIKLRKTKGGTTFYKISDD